MPMWFHCDAETGAIATAGVSVNETDAHLNAPPDGQIIVVVPDGSVSAPFSETPDFSVLREMLRQEINVSFNAFVRPMVSDLLGQDRRYSKKEVEALVWTEGDEAAHPEKYPYMLAEAMAKTAVLGAPVSVTEVRAGIMAQIAEAAADPIVEGFRVAHRQAVLMAPTLPAIVAAADVDWAAIMAAIELG
jgi:hypothetical protein